MNEWIYGKYDNIYSIIWMKFKIIEEYVVDLIMYVYDWLISNSYTLNSFATWQ